MRAYAVPYSRHAPLNATRAYEEVAEKKGGLRYGVTSYATARTPLVCCVTQELTLSI